MSLVLWHRLDETSGAVATPERGDRITDAEGRLFEVLALAGAQVYRACDAEGTRVRVHTKRIAV